eukprot:3191862-Pyramimonas_sp.AAC.1
MRRFGDFFHPSNRCGHCGCRGTRQDIPSCIVRRRLASPWVTPADGPHPDNLEAPRHPLDLR